jgi:hypothetical protein
MNTTLKMTLVAGALSLAVAGQANAAIINSAGLGNNVVLTVLDTTSATSFSANLGSTIQSFLTGAGVTFGGTSSAPAITGASTAASNFTYNDAALLSFLATANAATTTWSVTSATNTGLTGYGTSGLLATYSGAALPVTNATALGNAINAQFQYTSGINSVIGTGISVTSAAAAGISGGYAGTMGNFNTQTTWSNATALGSSANFLFITPSAPNARGVLQGSAVYQFADAAGVASTWTLGATGLTYTAAATAVAPVPEPGEWLLMLSGLALVGFIASRRKNSSSVSFA